MYSEWFEYSKELNSIVKGGEAHPKVVSRLERFPEERHRI